MRLAAFAVGEAARGAQEMHGAIADRSFRVAGPQAEPVRTVHDRVASATYGAIRLAARAAGACAGLASAAVPPDARPLSATPAGGVAVGIANGIAGDRLADAGSALAVRMTVRRRSDAVDVARDALGAAFPDATSKLAIFLHGLCGNEDSWRLGTGPAGTDRPEPFGRRLRRDLGYSPLYVRYNTGLRISENGRELDRLLGRLIEEWPAAIGEVALIGHSMGGLVARSACHAAQESRSTWIRSARHVVYIATPHGGAPLEKLAHLGGKALSAFPESRSLARLLDARSAGIRDLRHGSFLDDGWGEGRTRPLGRTDRVPFPATVSHSFVSGTVTRSPGHVAGRLLGDLLVRHPSAWGGPASGAASQPSTWSARHVGRTTHMRLLSHPAVYEQIREWLGADRFGGVPA